jgi:hypothetical protein
MTFIYPDPCKSNYGWFSIEATQKTPAIIDAQMRQEHQSSNPTRLQSHITSATENKCPLAQEFEASLRIRHPTQTHVQYIRAAIALLFFNKI